MLDGPARILDSAAASRILQKVWKLHVADSGFCPSVQNPEMADEWILDSGFWILRPLMSAFWILDSGFCILRPLLSAFWILDSAFWILRPLLSAFWILHSAFWILRFLGPP